MRERRGSGKNRRRGGERLERERIEQTEQMEETDERTEKRAQTDTNNDVESSQSRLKKGKMKSIFLSDFDEEAIMEFVWNFMTIHSGSRLNIPDMATSLR